MLNNKITIGLFAILIALILLLWFDRNNNKRELKRNGKEFKDSISTLNDIVLLTEIEVERHKDTIATLRKERLTLQAKTEKSRTVKIKVLSEPKIEVPDSIPQIVKDRIEQDSSKISALMVYTADLEAENRNLVKTVRSLENESKAFQVMNETKDLMIEQLNAQHENDQKLFKNERKISRKLKVALGVGFALWVGSKFVSD